MGLTERHWFENEDSPENYERALEDTVFNEEYAKIQTQAIEKTDEFIFRTIEPYCNTIFEIRISKSLLKRALTEYFMNHPEEYERI